MALDLLDSVTNAIEENVGLFAEFDVPMIRGTSGIAIANSPIGRAEYDMAGNITRQYAFHVTARDTSLEQEKVLKTLLDINGFIDEVNLGMKMISSINNTFILQGAEVKNVPFPAYVDEKGITYATDFVAEITILNNEEMS
ncbi:hypothetical protein [Listeria fleischmannii]|uniref:Minor capsid protein n=1 Tax=Listeria fleischmannii FSL S10-1203 TaxID=1265822 RepID=W7DEP8_9LIST|nr:hypothetical protein [Listeria fleischmannii]EUJ47653.1 hypothetical protein MCOL2_18074 [Listeria fleischmannii FSL S10-1203]